MPSFYYLFYDYFKKCKRKNYNGYSEVNENENRLMKFWNNPYIHRVCLFVRLLISINIFTRKTHKINIMEYIILNSNIKKELLDITINKICKQYLEKNE